jgi:hypothetical protein
MDDINALFIFISIQISQNVVITCAILNHFVVKYMITSHFYHVPQKTIALVVVKIVDLDISCK